MIEQHDGMCSKFVAWANGTGPAPSKIFAVIGLTDDKHAVQVPKKKPEFIPGSGLISINFHSPLVDAFEIDLNILVKGDQLLVKVITDGDVPSFQSSKISERKHGRPFTYGVGPREDGRWLFEFQDPQEEDSDPVAESRLFDRSAPFSNLACIDAPEGEDWPWDVTIRFEWSERRPASLKPPPMRTLR